MTDWQRIAEAFNASAKCKRRKDARPTVQHEPGCTFIACEHERCVCALTDPGDGPLSALLAKWQAVHG